VRLYSGDCGTLAPANEMKLLISARDAGAANNLAPVARLAEKDRQTQLSLIASEPAYSILQKAGLKVKQVTHHPATLLDNAQTLLTRHQPDAILVGLSGPDAGIDEALLASAKDIPTFALQDFWGDLNNGFGHYASVYLVRDALAEKLTVRRADVITRITGSPSLEKLLPTYKAQLKRKRLQLRNKLAKSIPIISLCLQPLWQEAGYRETVIQALKALPKCNLLVRTHPRDSQQTKQQIQRLLNQHCIQPWRFSYEPLEDMLCASDLLLSAFSNCALDLAYLNKAKKTHAAFPLYLMHNQKLKNLYQQWTGLNNLPLSDIGISETLYKRSRLKENINQAIQAKSRYLCRQRCKQLQQEPNAALKILEAIKESAALQNT